MSDFPSYLRLEYVPDGQAKSAFLSDLDGTLKSAEAKFSEFSSEAKRQLDNALSVPRNNFGSLDLGVESLRAAAAAQQTRAIAAREVAQATALAAQEEGDYSQKARLAVAAVQALAREEEDAAAKALAHAQAVEQVQERLNRQKFATDAVITSSRAGGAAQLAMTNTTRASRVAFVQLGQQLQDITVQAQLGTNAFIIFGQQVPQAAFALSTLAGSANKTQATIGRVATFLAGPWGAAVFAATAVLGPFIYDLIAAGDAADDASGKTYDFSSSLDVLALHGNQATEAMKQLANATRAAIAVQGDFLANEASIANQSVQKLENRIAESQAALSSMKRDAGSFGSLINPFAVPDLTEMKRLKDLIASDTEALKQARLSAANANIALSQQSALESNDPAERARGEYRRAAAQLELQRRESLKLGEDPLLYATGRNKFEYISEEDYRTQLGRLGEIRDAAIATERTRDRPNHATQRAMQEAARLEKFGDNAAESIARINEKFDAQPRLIDQAKQATRQLNDIIEDLEKRRPPGFENLIESAQKAKGEVQEALVRPYQELVEQSQRRIQIEGLLTSGLTTQADALQEIWKIERDLGQQTTAQKEEIYNIVAAEAQVTQELRRRQDVVNDYLDVTRSVRSELEGIFSGRGGVGNFGQIFKDLQGNMLVEQIFGDSLRQLDDLVKGRSGVTTNIDFLQHESQRAALSLGNIADAANGAVRQIMNPGATGAPTSSAFAASFGPEFMRSLGLTGAGAANDNPVLQQTKRLADSVDIGPMTLTPVEYSNLMTKAVAEPLMETLDGLLGAEFFAQFSGVLASALSGYVTGGEAGGILGLANGLNNRFGLEVLGEDLAKGLSENLAAGLEGAQTGTLFNAIFGGSKSGSQIGGAVGGIAGSLIPGVGTLVGSIVGSAIGSLFGGGAKYGYASSTGGTGGNDSEAKGAAQQLGDELSASIQRIAEALDAQVGSYATSIGVTDGKFRISTTGRTGELKSGYSDVQVFGKGDAAAQAALQAAVADAIRDGAIKGLSPAAQRLIQASDNIDNAVKDIQDFQSVFTRLREYQDPVGAALEKLGKEFDHLRDIFIKAGASAEEWGKLEQLYGIERADTIKRETAALNSSLRSLMDSLTVGNSALPLREREQLALASYTPLASRVAAGDTSAYDDFAEAAKSLLEIERSLYGSQSGYFGRLAEVTALTQKALDFSDAQAQASIANSDNPASPRYLGGNDNVAVVDAIASSNSYLNALNQNVGTTNALLRQIASVRLTGTGPIESF